SMAATWMNVVYGFGGLRSDGKVLSFRLSMAKMWKRFSYRILYRGSVLEVAVDRKNATFRVVEGKSVPADIFDKRYRIGKAETVVPLKKLG
ncbi:MAG: glycosyl hydrolase family 65 protein, partial [Planctomycetota bacterium]